VLEILDFNKIDSINSLEEYINNLVTTGIINEKDKKYINVNKIYNFLNSNLGNQIKLSNEVKKEVEFVAKLEKYSNALIQGVIDLYYKNQNGNIILIDFKTDKLNKDELFIKKYRIQLDIYKDAIESLTGLKVEKKYIYSFYLDKEIEVK
jgi:ATP-dependent helicase/nuclease subunit A